MKKQGILRESPSKSELFTHTIIIFEFLQSELTKLNTSLYHMQLLEEIMFKDGGLDPYNSAENIIIFFVLLKFSVGIYILSEVNINF